MSAFWGLLGFGGLVLIVAACLTVIGNYTHQLKRNQAKPQQARQK